MVSAEEEYVPLFSVTDPVGVGPAPVTDTFTLRLWPVSMLDGEGVTVIDGVRATVCVMVICAVPVFPA